MFSKTLQGGQGRKTLAAIQSFTMDTLKDMYTQFVTNPAHVSLALGHIKRMQQAVVNGIEPDEEDKGIFFSPGGLAGLGQGILSKENIKNIDWKTLLGLLKKVKDDDDVHGAIKGLADYLTSSNVRKKGNTATPHLLINRMVATMRPQELFFVLKPADLEIIRSSLENLYSIKVLFEKKSNRSQEIDWYEKNKALFNAIKEQLKGIEGFDEKELSCMGWHIKLSLTNMMDIQNLLIANKNIVLTGAPGTGKTYMAKEIARAMTKDNEKHWKMVQFHPSYDYTDFVEGLRPLQIGKEIGFERTDGVFKEFCKKALEAPKDEKFVFIIDEINRGELSKIFGELFFSIDPGYRGENGRVDTQYQNLITDEKDLFKDGFFVPENVYVIGTMNDIDRSVESMDFAIRRRFAWHEVKWEDTFDSILASLELDPEVSDVKERFKILNEKIEKDLGEEFCIGGSHLCKLENYKGEEKPLQALWNNHIKGIVKEYLRGNPDLKIEDYEKAFLGKKKDSNNQATQET